MQEFSGWIKRRRTDLSRRIQRLSLTLLVKTGFEDLATLIKFGVFISCVFVVGSAAVTDWQSRNVALTSAEINSQNLAHLLEENVKNTFRTIEMIMNLVPQPHVATYDQQERNSLTGNVDPGNRNDFQSSRQSKFVTPSVAPSCLIFIGRSQDRGRA